MFGVWIGTINKVRETMNEYSADQDPRVVNGGRSSHALSCRRSRHICPKYVKESP